MVDSKQLGQFICTCRKAKKLTQKQLGELLDVTEKAVSKWETGRSIPDIRIIEALCEALEIDIGELLSGKRIDAKDYKDETKKHVMQMIALLLMWLPIINNQTDALLPPVTPINLFCCCACIALFMLIRYTDKKLPEKSVRMTNTRLEIGHGVMYMIIFMSMFFLTPNSRRLASEASADKIVVVLVIVALAMIFSAVMSIIFVKARRWYDKEN